MMNEENGSQRPKRKLKAAVALGRRGGKKGGKIRSEAKSSAARANLENARQTRWIVHHALKQLLALGWSNPVKTGPLTIEITAPDGLIHVGHPRDILRDETQPRPDPVS